MKTDFYEVDCRPLESLYATAVRYRPDSDAAEDSDGLTLILAHGLSTHKETWTPCMRHLFALAASGAGPRIVDAWSIECPNHGKSALINEDSLKSNYAKPSFNAWIYPRIMLAFLQSRPAGVDFSQRAVVLVGHSYGGNSLLMLDTIQHLFTPRGYILAASYTTNTRETCAATTRAAAAFIMAKRDTWPSRAAALHDLGTVQPGFKSWDREALRLFVEHALRESTSDAGRDISVPPEGEKAVTLACSRNMEAACYYDTAGHAPGWERLQQLYAEGREVHLIHSVKDEFRTVGDALRNSQLIPEPVSGRGPTRVHFLQRGGHMFVQTVPEDTARAVYDALCDIASASASANGVPRSAAPSIRRLSRL